MQVKSLKITNVRVYERAEFVFQPGMNLLVGINGAGKSTVLDVLRIMFSQVLPDFTAANRRSVAKSFDKDTDISIGSGFLTVEMLFDVDPEQSQQPKQQSLFETEPIHLHYLVHIPREDFVINEKRKGEVRDQSVDLEERHDLNWVNDEGFPIGESLPSRTLKQSQQQPIVVFFSAHRSVVQSKKSSTGGQAAAFAEALEDRALYLNEFALWWRTREALAKEDASARRLLDILDKTVSSFLDGCSGLHVAGDERPSLWLNKNGTTLNASQLSDGERSMLALVFDLSRRLALANPQLDDPVHEGKAVVLIDEIDLHLHPRWQRTIVDQLRDTFPQCQFIATTHSPTIISEIKPDSIILIDNGKLRHPRQSLGMDTTWIMRNLMGDIGRPDEFENLLQEIRTLIDDDDLENAQEKLTQLRNEIGDDEEIVSLQAQIDSINFWEDDDEE